MAEGQKTAIIAIGGNSLIADKQHEDDPSQTRFPQHIIMRTLQIA